MTATRKHLHAVDEVRPSYGAYPSEFKAAAVARVRSGEPIAAVARESGIARNTLKAWTRGESSVSEASEDARSSEASASGVVAAAASGDRLSVLVALRDELAAKIAGGIASRDLPAHARLLNETMREIDHLRDRKTDADDGPASVPDGPFNYESI